MPQRTPLTARAEALMLDLQVVAGKRDHAKVEEIAREAAAVFGAIDLERIDFIYETNHGRGRRARDRQRTA